LNQAVQTLQSNWTQETLNDIVIDAIQDIKGKHIVKLDLRRIKDGPTDYFIICEGDSNTQVGAIAANIHRRLKTELGVHPNHIEGTGSATWVCLDYFNTVVHVFYRELRPFYGLEDLWGDAKFTEYETL
jgi:ribosome-associated protein